VSEDADPQRLSRYRQDMDAQLLAALDPETPAVLMVAAVPAVTPHSFEAVQASTTRWADGGGVGWELQHIDR
jgi:hypothetical protein